MNYLKIAIVPMIIFYGTNYGVRQSALRDMLITIGRNKQKSVKKVPTVPESQEATLDTDFVAKEYCYTKFERSKKLAKYAKERQNRNNKKHNKSPWKPHSQKRKKQLLHYIASYR